jgi:HD superfamily phosphohydrolase
MILDRKESLKLLKEMKKNDKIKPNKKEKELIENLKEKIEKLERKVYEKMSDVSYCDVCEYNGEKQCNASEGEFGECKTAQELFNKIKKQGAIEELKKLGKFIDDWYSAIDGERLTEYYAKRLKKRSDKKWIDK